MGLQSSSVQAHLHSAELRNLPTACRARPFWPRIGLAMSVGRHAEHGKEVLQGVLRTLILSWRVKDFGGKASILQSKLALVVARPIGNLVDEADGRTQRMDAKSFS